jgi:hypothetical protein
MAWAQLGHECVDGTARPPPGMGLPDLTPDAERLSEIGEGLRTVKWNQK